MYPDSSGERHPYAYSGSKTFLTVSTTSWTKVKHQPPDLRTQVPLGEPSWQCPEQKQVKGPVLGDGMLGRAVCIEKCNDGLVSMVSNKDN